MVVSHHVRLLGFELSTFGRAVGALTHWAISPALMTVIWRLNRAHAAFHDLALVCFSSHHYLTGSQTPVAGHSVTKTSSKVCEPLYIFLFAEMFLLVCGKTFTFRKSLILETFTLILFFIFFWDSLGQNSLYRPGWSQTHRDLPASTSLPMLELNAHTTTQNWQLYF
jgi:hypothetical protein